MFKECSRMFIIVSTLELLLFQQFFHGRPDGKLEPSGFGLRKCHLKYTSFKKYSFFLIWSLRSSRSASARSSWRLRSSKRRFFFLMAIMGMRTKSSNSKKEYQLLNHCTFILLTIITIYSFNYNYWHTCTFFHQPNLSSDIHL